MASPKRDSDQCKGVTLSLDGAETFEGGSSKRVRRCDPSPPLTCDEEVGLFFSEPEQREIECAATEGCCCGGGGDARGHLDRGSVFAARGEYDAALSEWRRGLECAASGRAKGLLHESRAQVYMLKEEWFNAVRAAEASVAVYPEWPAGRSTLGRALLNLGEPSLAAVSFQRALDLLETWNPSGAPDRPSPGVSAGEVLEDLDYARLQARRAAEIAGRSPPSSCWSGREGAQPVPLCEEEEEGAKPHKGCPAADAGGGAAREK